MARRESREEEYIRRMRERGYTPTLAGMDDDDIEWELAKMDGRNPLQEARPAERPLNPRYKPVDPGLQARILRMFGQPYDKSAIDPNEAHYLNGWDNGDDGDEETKPQSRPSQPRPGEQSPAEQFNPWKNLWKLDWGQEGSPADKSRPPEPLMGKNPGPGVVPYASMGNNGGGLVGGQGIVSALAKPGSPAATPLGLYKPGLETAKPGDFVIGHDGVIRRAANENALLRAVDNLTARILEPRPEQGKTIAPAVGTAGGDSSSGMVKQGDRSGSGGNIILSVDPFAINAPLFESAPAGDGSAVTPRGHYRETEVVPLPNPGGYIDAGASRNNEARSGTADDFTFTFDPLENMGVRGGLKMHTFGDQPERFSGIHQGVDLYAPVGTPVRAVGSGEIVETGDQGEKGYGKYAIIKFDVNWKTYYALYAHLSKHIDAKDADGNPRKVSAGEIIGETGISGNAKNMKGENQHLHFELATESTFGEKLGSGRLDPMPRFRTRMTVK
jgi:murein DD-endopeptidase MepM/ murein hydrolase activator NlpD